VGKFMVHRKKERIRIIINNNNKKRSKNNKSPKGQSHIFGGSKRVGVTIESYGKLEMLYINVDNF
jgi:hypothetical protein